MFKPFVRFVLLFACLLPVLALAQNPPAREIDVPAGNLVTALDTLARQTGVQFVYSTSQLASVRTRGVHGNLTAQAALSKLLAGSGFTVQRDASGAMVIVKIPATSSSATSTSPPEVSPQRGSESQPTQTLKKVVVLGSRIPRSQIAGPSPVVTITAQDIQERGLTTVPDIMTSLTQNLGQLDNNQYTNGFTPGAQAVDLRGLGPSYTLVLVNGRRIANYPAAYGGSSNFTDISNIPVAMIDRIQVLTGSASAVYGSDAVSGVINFILKKKADGTTVQYRAGVTQHGGRGTQLLDVSTGFSKGKLDALFGLELYDAKPLWNFQRSYTDSRLDSPSSSPLASRTFYRSDVYGDYLDPGKATCENLSYLDQGSIIYTSRPGYAYDGGPGYFCGTNNLYGTLENGRKMATFFGSATYHFNDYTDLYLNVLAGTSHQDSYNSSLDWYNCETVINDCTDTPFYNTATGQVEQWGRDYFTINENGGLTPGMIRIINNSLSLSTGIKGTFGGDSDWNYDANFEHSQNNMESKEPALIAAKAQALYLGPSLGVDPDSGYKMYDAPVSRLYTPLTVAQFRSITQDSIDNDKSRAENWQFTLTNTNLFNLPAGPVGFAAVAEYGNSYFGLDTDPLSRNGTYYGLHNAVAIGSRSHAAGGYEFSIPVFSQLTVTTAGRYDRYKYGGNTAGKFTYALGLEYRPFQSLLLRGSLSTGFRAPDLSYVFAGLSGSSSGGIDYYQCRLNEPDSGPDYYDNCTWGDVSYVGSSVGSPDLKDETSRSLTYGFVFAPTPNFDINADFYRISLKNKVEYQSSDQVLREEADCRLGVTIDGAPVDGSSAFCQRVEGEVARRPANSPFDPEGITSVLVFPINAASDETSGIDFGTHYRLHTRHAGSFGFNFGITYVIMHKTQLAAGQPIDDELTDLYYYGIPRTKANASVTWNYQDFTGTLYGSRLGGLPNYDGTQRLAPTFLYNLSLGYHLARGLDVSLMVDNLFDTPPQYDSTWTSYPYYYRSWFSPIGRAYYVQMNMKFGGKNGM